MRKTRYAKIIANLRQTWILCFGAITLLGVSGIVLPFKWMPFLAFFLIIPILAFGNRNLSENRENCSLLTHYTIYALIYSGVTMIILYLANANWLKLSYLTFSNPEIPYISSAIVYPITTIVYSVALLRRARCKYCKECLERAGYSVEETKEHALFTEQIKFMIRNLVFITFSLSVVVILYYRYLYIDVNLNSPDIFFFFLIPGIVYVLSVVYIMLRLSYVTVESQLTINKHDSKLHTQVRFIVVKENLILLHELDGLGIWDTPATKEINYQDNVSEEEAREIFTELADTKDYYLRRLFSTSTAHHNAFHFIVLLDTPEMEVPTLNGSWHNLYQIDIMLKSGLISRPFAYDIHRVYTMTMAWKTYDREGNRLYPIKNYRPTFRLTDFKDWDIDYSDMHWLNVSNNNEDRPFFKIRRFWRRFITGADNRWRKSS